MTQQNRPLGASLSARRAREAILAGLSALRTWRQSRSLWIGIVTLCAAAVTAPALDTGLFFEDHGIAGFVLDHLHGTGQSTNAWWNLFDHYGRNDASEVPQRIASGALPWWSPRSMKFAFLRPLAAASHYLDYLCWPSRPWAMHVHNTFWYALCALLAARLYFRFLPPLAAGMAALIYAVDEAHVQGASWLSGRNTLMTAAFVLLTLTVWERARRTRAPGQIVFAMVCLACAHGSSEGAVAVWPYLIGYEITHAASDRGFWARLSALWPLAAVSVGWLSLASFAGYGARGGDLYVDPRSTPLLFLQFAEQRLPRLLRGQFLWPQVIQDAIPASLEPFTTGVSYGILAVLGLLCWTLVRRSASARMFSIGFLGSALIACAVEADPRMLFVIGFGAHGLLAQLICECVNEALRPRISRALCGAVAAMCLVMHIPLALAAGPSAAHVLPALDARARKLAHDLTAAAGHREHVLVLNSTDMLSTSFAAAYIWVFTKGTQFVHVLGECEQPVRVQRPRRNTLILEPMGGYLSSLRGKRVRDIDQAFYAGQVINTFLWQITIESITSDERPARVRFELANPDDAHLAWLSWNPAQDRFDPVRLPEVGETLWLPGKAKPDAVDQVPLSAAFR